MQRLRVCRGNRYDPDDDNALDILEMKASKLPGPFELAMHTNKMWRERDFIDWYIYQVTLSPVFPRLDLHC